VKRIILNLFLVMAVFSLSAKETGFLSNILLTIVFGPKHNDGFSSKYYNEGNGGSSWYREQGKREALWQFKHYFNQLYKKVNTCGNKGHHSEIVAHLAEGAASGEATVGVFLKSLVGEWNFGTSNYRERYSQYWSTCDRCHFRAFLQYASKETKQKILEIAVCSGDSEVIEEIKKQNSSVDTQGLIKTAEGLNDFWRTRVQEFNGRKQEQDAHKRSNDVLEALKVCGES